MPLTGEYEPSTIAWVREQVETYERTNGREADTVSGTDIPVIIVTCRGASSGKIRKFALVRVQADGEYALVASKGGAPDNPDWYHNLIAEPVVEIQDGPEPAEYATRVVTGDERIAWWKRAAEILPTYDEYAERTGREIPVFVATPLV